MTATLSPVTRALTRAKLLARTWAPYLSHILASMRTYVEPSIDALAIDSDCRLYVNEKWVESVSRETLAYALLHEVLHVVLSHAQRRKQTLPDADAEQRLWWNIAADLCIQQMLARQFSHAEPDGIITIRGKVPGTDTPFLHVPNLVQGMTTEGYYSVLLDYVTQQQQPASSQPSSNGQPEKDGQEQDAGDGEGDEEGSSPALDPNSAGSGSDGHRRDYEQPSRMAAQAAVRARLAECERKIAEMEQQGIGSVPGEVRAALNARLHPQPDPFDQLRSVVSRSVASPLGADEYTYRRLRRRQPPNCARLRGVIRYAPECSIIVDTSGSMIGTLRDRAMMSVSQGLRKVRQPRVICFDAAVRDSRRMSSMKDFLWCGGGGTDMARACMEEDKRARPDAIVVITDGQTHWPPKRTRARLIIALCSKTTMPTPSWAKVVHCYQEGPRYGG